MRISGKPKTRGRHFDFTVEEFGGIYTPRMIIHYEPNGPHRGARAGRKANDSVFRSQRSSENQRKCRVESLRSLEPSTAIQDRLDDPGDVPLSYRVDNVDGEGQCPLAARLGQASGSSSKRQRY